MQFVKNRALDVSTFVFVFLFFSLISFGCEVTAARSNTRNKLKMLTHHQSNGLDSINIIYFLQFYLIAPSVTRNLPAPGTASVLTLPGPKPTPPSVFYENFYQSQFSSEQLFRQYYFAVIKIISVYIVYKNTEK